MIRLLAESEVLLARRWKNWAFQHLSAAMELIATECLTMTGGKFEFSCVRFGEHPRAAKATFDLHQDACWP